MHFMYYSSSCYEIWYNVDYELINAHFFRLSSSWLSSPLPWRRRIKSPKLTKRLRLTLYRMPKSPETREASRIIHHIRMPHTHRTHIVHTTHTTCRTRTLHTISITPIPTTTNLKHQDVWWLGIKTEISWKTSLPRGNLIKLFFGIIIQSIPILLVITNMFAFEFFDCQFLFPMLIVIIKLCYI